MKKLVINDFKIEVEYLQGRINNLNNLFKSYIEKNKCDEVETIKFLFDDNDKDYDLYPVNNNQYQSFSDKNLLPFNEYLETVRPKLAELMTNDYKFTLNMNVIFSQERLKNSSDKRRIYIKSKNTTDIDEVLSQLTKKHKELSESLKNINLISEGVESATYNFTVINTFIETPHWLSSKKCIVNPQNNDNKCFQYALILSLYHD